MASEQMSQLNISLLQIVMVLVTVRMVGWLFQRMGQSIVVGEMIAGLLLGPSLYGRLAPAAFAFTYPADSMDVLFTLSRLGVWLFMFLVGAELDLSIVKQAGRLVVITSQFGILLPLLMGSALSFLLYPSFAGQGIPLMSFALFMGVSMSVTAFPVLARILRERSMTTTELGSTAIACAALNDITAWCLLAVTVLFIHPASREITMLYRLAALLAYFAFMWLAARPLLRRMVEKQSDFTPETFGLLLVMLLISCVTTQVIGIHALFGAFFFGVVLPKEEWLIKGLEQRLEPLIGALLLPLFFVFSGIRTNIGLISGWSQWGLCIAIISVAVAGKFFGAAVPARLMGQSWSKASALGALMNTRGLMELVILNVGLELNVITPTLFSMMVVMAVVTTFMTSPWLDWIVRRSGQPLQNSATAA